MNTEKITYFIYARKSTEGEDRQSLSISSQIEDISRLQTQQGLRVTETITDSASAKIPFNRPAYASMIKRIKKGEAGGIIVWKIDRLARNHLEWGELMHLLQTGVIKSIWTMHREYLSSDSALLISLEASMATQFSVDLSEIVKRGLRKKVSLGQPPIIAPTGYLNTKHNDHGSNSIIVDPKRWPLMRKAFDLMLTGQYTVGQVAAILNDGYNFRSRSTKKRMGKPLATSVLYRSIIDPFYTGYFNYKGELHKGMYKPMITLEEFDTIQVILGRKEKPKPHKHDFAFTGFIRCGCCGCAITASRKLKKLQTTGEYKDYTFYHCTKRKGAATCADKRYTTEKEMLALIEEELQNIALVPRWKSWAAETVKADNEDELQKQQKLLKSIGDYEQKLLSELDNLLDLRISNELSDEQYNQKKAERRHQLIRVQEKYSKRKRTLTTGSSR
ncbi:MAG: recombinase family protein [Mucilaginibacter sp.]|uniref:recombinase family protein n=1 Tax=Mucilaginibacter sp. TaxID=1882438 RepID=UPI003264BEAC